MERKKRQGRVEEWESRRKDRRERGSGRGGEVFETIGEEIIKDVLVTKMKGCLEDLAFLSITEMVVSAVGDERLNNQFVSFLAGQKQRRRTFVSFRVQADALGENEPDDLVIALLTGDCQGSLALVVPELSALLAGARKKKAHDSRKAFQTGHHQSRLAIVVSVLDVRSS